MFLSLCFSAFKVEEKKNTLILCMMFSVLDTKTGLFVSLKGEMMLVYKPMVFFSIELCKGNKTLWKPLV